MKTIIKSLVLISALSLPVATFAAEGDSVGTKMSDSVVTAKVKAKFARDKLVHAMNIKVETDSKGMVELSGIAKTKVEAEQAVQLAKSVKGVTSVKDNIKITQ